MGEAEIAGKRMLLRIRSVDGMRVIFLSPCTPMEELVGEAFLYVLRGEMMQLEVNASILRAHLSPEDASGLSALNCVSRSLYRIKRTIQNLSVIRGAQTGNLLFLPQTLDLVPFFRDIMEAVTLHFPQPVISFSAPTTLPGRGDPALLETMALNLLSNCILHAKGCTRVRVTLHSAGDQAILSVDDDGCGIPGDRLHTVLERYRYDCGLSAAENGPGLGLTAAREIARIHGGTLLLESREGIGTAVRVSLGHLSRSAGRMRSPEEAYDKSYDAVLTGLAPCLPPEAFDAPDRK
jgi:signal transduction histidine kinase